MIRPVTINDIEIIRQKSVSRGFIGAENTVQIMDALELDGKLLVIGGFIIITPCTAWVWTEITQEGIEHINLTYRTIREWMENNAKIHGIRRLQAYVLESFPEAQRFCSHLGFTVESIMKDFVPDGNARLYVRIL